MKSKTRVEKLERQIGNDQRFQIIEWDRSRLTKDEVDFIGTRGGVDEQTFMVAEGTKDCLLYTSPSPRDLSTSRMPSSA